MSIDTPCEVLGLKDYYIDILMFLAAEIPEGATVPFIVVRMRTGGTGEKYILKSGEGVTWDKYSRTNIDSGDISLAGEGRLKHFKAEKKIIIYSNPGPSHKLTFGILKTKFPEYSSIIWRDG